MDRQDNECRIPGRSKKERPANIFIEDLLTSREFNDDNCVYDRCIDGPFINNEFDLLNTKKYRNSDDCIGIKNPEIFNRAYNDKLSNKRYSDINKEFKENQIDVNEIFKETRINNLRNNIGWMDDEINNGRNKFDQKSNNFRNTNPMKEMKEEILKFNNVTNTENINNFQETDNNKKGKNNYNENINIGYVKDNLISRTNYNQTDIGKELNSIRNIYEQKHMSSNNMSPEAIYYMTGESRHKYMDQRVNHDEKYMSSKTKSPEAMYCMTDESRRKDFIPIGNNYEQKHMYSNTKSPEAIYNVLNEDNRKEFNPTRIIYGEKGMSYNTDNHDSIYYQSDESRCKDLNPTRNVDTSKHTNLNADVICNIAEKESNPIRTAYEQQNVFSNKENTGIFYNMVANEKESNAIRTAYEQQNMFSNKENTSIFYNISDKESNQIRTAYEQQNMFSNKENTGIFYNIADKESNPVRTAYEQKHTQLNVEEPDELNNLINTFGLTNNSATKETDYESHNKFCQDNSDTKITKRIKTMSNESLIDCKNDDFERILDEFVKIEPKNKNSLLSSLSELSKIDYKNYSLKTLENPSIILNDEKSIENNKEEENINNFYLNSNYSKSISELKNNENTYFYGNFHVERFRNLQIRFKIFWTKIVDREKFQKVSSLRNKYQNIIMCFYRAISDLSDVLNLKRPSFRTCHNLKIIYLNFYKNGGILSSNIDSLNSYKRFFSEYLQKYFLYVVPLEPYNLFQTTFCNSREILINSKNCLKKENNLILRFKINYENLSSINHPSIYKVSVEDLIFCLSNGIYDDICFYLEELINKSNFISCNIFNTLILELIDAFIAISFKLFKPNSSLNDLTIKLVSPAFNKFMYFHRKRFSSKSYKLNFNNSLLAGLQDLFFKAILRFCKFKRLVIKEEIALLICDILYIKKSFISNKIEYFHYILNFMTASESVITNSEYLLEIYRTVYPENPGLVVRSLRHVKMSKFAKNIIFNLIQEYLKERFLFYIGKLNKKEVLDDSGEFETITLIFLPYLLSFPNYLEEINNIIDGTFNLFKFQGLLQEYQNELHRRKIYFVNKGTSNIDNIIYYLKGLLRHIKY